MNSDLRAARSAEWNFWKGTRGWKRIPAIPGRLLGWTLGRLGLIPIVIVSLGISPPLTAVALAAFVLADLYDGVLARQLSADGPSRRVLDSVVDRISIWAVFIAVVLAGYLSVVLLALLLLRDLYCGVLCYEMLRKRNVAIRADWLYRALNLMLAAWVVIAPTTTSATRSILFLAVLGFSIFVAADLRQSIEKILRMQPPVRDAVLAAGELRKS
jgi:phosphatidylglycerophosphate synthase